MGCNRTNEDSNGLPHISASRRQIQPHFRCIFCPLPTVTAFPVLLLGHSDPGVPLRKWFLLVSPGATSEGYYTEVHSGSSCL